MKRGKENSPGMEGKGVKLLKLNFVSILPFSLPSLAIGWALHYFLLESL